MSHDAAMELAVKERGGTAVGLEICEAVVSGSLHVRTPEYVLLRSADLAEAVNIIPGQGWAIKYSGTEESFSSLSTRGKHSSASRRIMPDDSLSRVEEKINNAWVSRPQGTVGLVFQKMLDLTREYALLYIDIDETGISVEVDHRPGRSLTILDRHFVHVVCETIGVDPGRARPGPHVVAVVRFLMAERSLGVRVNLEALQYMDTDDLWLLQLRPTPPDRPCDGVLPAHHSQCNPLWSTRFVWGELNVAVRDGSIASRGLSPVQILRSIPGPAMASLVTGMPTLFSRTGFRTSHERWHLPAPEDRDGYAAMHVPDRLIEFSREEELQVHSDGNIGMVCLASRCNAR